MAIRAATQGDADQIAAVLRAAFAEYESLYTPAGFAATTPGPDVILSRMREGPVWVAIQQRRVIGTVAAVHQSDGCYVRGMAVLPQARAKGVGRQLLMAVEQYALEHGFRRLSLSTTPFLDRAIRLYDQFGFERGSEGDLFGTPLFTMTKEYA